MCTHSGSWALVGRPLFKPSLSPKAVQLAASSVVVCCCGRTVLHFMRRRRIEVLGFTFLEAIHFIDIGVTHHHSPVGPILAPGSFRYCFEGLTASRILSSSRL